MSGSQPSAELEDAARVHRQAAAIAAAADRAGVATAELPGVRARLAVREQRLTEWANRIGAPLPQLTPTPSEIASAGPALGDLSEAAAAAAVRSIESTLDAADAAMVAAGASTTVDGLSETPSVGSAARGVATPYGQHPAADQPTQRPQWEAAKPAPPQAPTAAPAPAATTAPAPPAAPASGPTQGGWLTRSVYLRNAAIYGGYAFVVFSVQMALFLLLDETRLPAAAPACLLVLPALAWAAGYLTIGAVARPPQNGKLDRTPRLGVLVSLIPNALLCAMLGLLFVADAVN
jgi:hypothetical protein